MQEDTMPSEPKTPAPEGEKPIELRLAEIAEVSGGVNKNGPPPGNPDPIVYGYPDD